MYQQNQYEIDQQRRNAYVQEAENYRMTKKESTKKPLLAKLGKTMVDIGQSLQQRYEEQPIKKTGTYPGIDPV